MVHLYTGQEKKISLEHTKLDLQDRLDKRNLKHQERMSLVPKLTQIIGRAKLAKFLATTGYGTDSKNSSEFSSIRKGTGNCVEMMDRRSSSSRSFDGEPALRHRRKIYSDKEVAALLKHNDDDDV